MDISQYLQEINHKYKQGNTTEHSFRGLLEQLIENIEPKIKATNEPKRQKCGAPDYIITKNNIPIGFIEAKDIGDNDLEGNNSKGNKEQFDRYKDSLSNIIFTDYLNFFYFRDKQLITKVTIGELTTKGIKPVNDSFLSFNNMIKDFCSYVGQTITSSKKLAEMMAVKARLLSEIIEKALNSDEENQENSTLKDQMNAFKSILIHDITAKEFSDIYSQTIAYGMFAARLHDTSLNTFSRQEAAELIPKTNPFLRKLFMYIAGPDIDDRIKWIVDSLADIFRACNIEELLKNFGKSTQTEDPIIHFYETFLSEYDPKLRKARGVWYTPQPVVNFIVRAVDDILKTEFGLPNGLADNSKTKIKVEQQGIKVEQEVHRVQILDPATGTGTFLAEVIKHIYTKFEGQEGIWSNYVDEHLLPRLNGFELLMASYAMAHLKLDMLLTETGYKPKKEQRFRIYLTNSLEEYHPDTGTLFANWLSTEANEANYIKRDTPVMCVIGNPPYAVSSSNKSEWIEKLIVDYKKDMNERNIQPLSDDYIKFIRFGQHFIDKNGSGILAYISNNSFIDGIIHRQMRKNLLESFDKIYILDLHGNAKKKEVCPDGSPDQNVFDIMQGVSINIFVKTGKKINKFADTYNFDLYGKREHKYSFLTNKTLETLKWNKLQLNSDKYFFVEKDFKGEDKYKTYIDLTKLFILNSMGIATGKDDELVSFDSKCLENKFNIKASKFSYRPFDDRFTIFDNKILQRARYKISINLIERDNLSLNIAYFSKNLFPQQIISKNIVCRHLVSGETYFFPLYLYPEQQTIGGDTESDGRVPNLNLEIVQQIADKLGLSFTHKKFPSDGGVTESRGGSRSSTTATTSTTAHRSTSNYMSLPYNAKLKDRAKELRKAGNLAEILFWNQVKNKQFKGLDFDRQKIVGNYIVDFYCTNYNVVIEIDGSSHDEKQEYDEARDKFLEGLGLTVIRIADREVRKNIGGVMGMLSDHPALSGTPPMDGSFEHLNSFSPIDILDYIYAVLHSPSYREKYKEFLKIDFPRVPYPKDKITFWNLVELGSQIREIHLLESPIVEKYITKYPIAGDNLVNKIKYVDGKVYLNDTQYFDNVPEIAWNFYIGGYQPAQKWLKDRKDRTLDFNDILHYQKIIVALSETDRLMKEIDKIEIE